MSRITILFNKTTKYTLSSLCKKHHSRDRVFIETKSNVKTGRKRSYSYRKLQRDLLPRSVDPRRPRSAEIYRFKNREKASPELPYYSIKQQSIMLKDIIKDIPFHLEPLQRKK